MVLPIRTNFIDGDELLGAGLGRRTVIGHQAEGKMIDVARRKSESRVKFEDVLAAQSRISMSSRIRSALALDELRQLGRRSIPANRR
jgi:hypothetical protein